MSVRLASAQLTWTTGTIDTMIMELGQLMATKFVNGSMSLFPFGDEM